MQKKISLKFILLFSFIVILTAMTLSYAGINYTFTHKSLKEESYKILYNYTTLSSKALEDRLNNIANSFHALENSPEFLSFYSDVALSGWTNQMNSYIEVDNYITNIYYENYDYLDSIYISIKDPSIDFYKRHNLFKKINFDYDKWWANSNQDTTHYQWRYSSLNPVFESTSREDIITLFKFIGDESSNINGTIMFHLKTSQFNDILLKNSLYEDGYFFILDDKGETINFTTDAYYNLSNKAKDKIQTKEHGAFQIKGEHELAVVYTTLQPLEWKLCYIVPENNLFHNYTDLMEINYVIILLILFPAIAIAIWIIRSITRHIKMLLDQVRILEVGELDIHYQPSPLLEMDILNKRFFLMATRINELLTNIKREKEREKELELALLQAQIRPHFLYNTLYSLKQQCLLEGSQTSAKLIQNLSDFYRISLSKGSSLITLEKEMEHIKNYINIEQSKAYQPFQVLFNLDPYILEEQIVKLSLQPIIENAIQHGIKNSRSEGTITIEAQPYECHIGIQITDNGCGMDNKVLEEIRKQCNHDLSLITPVTHYGIANVHHRLRLHFGADYGLDIKSQEKVGTCVTIRIPYSSNEEDTHV